MRQNGIDGAVKQQIQQHAQGIEIEFIREGYNISTIARDFLDLCAYCEIRFLCDNKNNYHAKLIVDPTGYIDSDDRVELYNSFKKQLYTIAYMNDGYEIMLDEDNNTYLFWDGNWNFLGSNLISGIEEIFKSEGSRLNSQYARTYPCNEY